MLCCASLAMDALHTLSTRAIQHTISTYGCRLFSPRHMGDVLSEIEELPYKLRDKYLVFAFFRMEWQRNTDSDSDAGDLQTVGHWDTVTVPLNRLVPTRVADRLAVAASTGSVEQDELEQDQLEQELGQEEQEEQEEQEAQQEVEDTTDATAAERTYGYRDLGKRRKS